MKPAPCDLLVVTPPAAEDLPIDRADGHECADPGIETWYVGIHMRDGWNLSGMFDSAAEALRTGVRMLKAYRETLSHCIGTGSIRVTNDVAEIVGDEIAARLKGRSGRPEQGLLDFGVSP